MLAFVVQRLFQSIVVMLVVAFACFGLFRYVGDPINNMVGQETSIADREALRERLGLNDPMLVQYARFVGNAVQGEFGVSLPTFVIGIGLIYIFAVTLQILPSFGRGQTVDLGWWSTGLLTTSGLKAIILPSITLCLYQLTLLMRLVRAEMLEVLRTDYIKFARARGLSNRAINFSHALKNTLVPVITITGLQIGSLIAFSIITETVFQWPGMGFLFIQAVQFADIPVMAAYLVMVAFFFVAINFLVDMLYFAVDPRIKVGQGGS